MRAAREHVVRIRDADVGVTVYGDAGIAIVPLPGGAARCADYFPDLLDSLPDHRVVVYDRLGTGSSRTTQPVSLRSWSQDTITVLDALGIERALMVGHSLGGAVALHVLLDQPDRVAAALLLDPTTINDPKSCARGARGAALLAASNRLPVVGPSALDLLTRVSRPKSMSPSAQRAYDATLTGAWVGDTARAVRTLNEDAIAFQQRTLRPVDVPVVLASADRKPGHRMRRAHESLTSSIGARFEVWPDTGHALHLQRPDLLIARVRSLIEEIEERPTV
jgi:pimeloyl-ACP methyl ester carboxylesterase